jgi:hypothetical protein
MPTENNTGVDEVVEEVNSVEGFDPGGEDESSYAGDDGGAQRERDERGRFVPKDKSNRFEDRLSKIANSQEDRADLIRPQRRAKAQLLEELNGTTPDADENFQSGDPAAKSGEGPSEDLLTVARLANIPEDVIATARDDDALRGFIGMADRFQAPQQQQQYELDQQQHANGDATAAEELLAKLMLPEEDYPADDPVRKQSEHLVSAINTVRKEVREELDAIVEYLRKQSTTTQTHRLTEDQKRFDSLVDALNVPTLAKRSEITNRNNPAFIARNALYAKFDVLEKQLPDVEPNELLAIAYRAVFKKPLPTPKQVAKREALVRQSGSRLGGAPARRAAEPELDDASRFEQKIERMFARR